MKKSPHLITVMARCPIVCLFLFCLFIGGAYGGDATWNVTTGGTLNWSDTLNWSPNTIPNGISDNAQVDNNIVSDTIILLNATNIVLESLSIGDSNNTNRFTIGGPNKLIISGGTTLLEERGSLTDTIDAGLDVLSAMTANVGGLLNVNGAVNLGGSSAVFEYLDKQGTGTMNINGNFRLNNQMGVSILMTAGNLNIAGPTNVLTKSLSAFGEDMVTQSGGTLSIAGATNSFLGQLSSSGGITNFGSSTIATTTNLNGYVHAASSLVNSGDSSIVLGSVIGLSSGQVVSGPGIQLGTTISSIAGNTVNLSLPTNAASPLNTAFLFEVPASVRGYLNISGATVNFGQTGAAAAVTLDADRILITSGQLNLQNGTGGGVTMVTGGATNTLTIDGGTVSVYNNGGATGTVNFAATAGVVMNNNATFNFTDNQGPTNDTVIAFLNSASNDTVLRSQAGSARLVVNTAGTDVFNGILNLTDAAAASGLLMNGAGQLTLGGTRNNLNARVFVENGTVVLAKASNESVTAINTQSIVGEAANADIETLRLGGTYVGDLGSFNLSNYVNQIDREADLTINASGVLDLNGHTEGFDLLSGGAASGPSAAGKVSNSSATKGTLILGEGGSNGQGSFSGIIEDGTGAGGVAFWKNGTGTFTLNNINTYTKETLISRGTLTLTGASGALSGSSEIQVSDGATLLLENNGTGAGNANRLNNNTSSTLLLNSGNFVLRRPDSGALTEQIGILRVQNGNNQIRLDHSRNGVTDTVLQNDLRLALSGYVRDAGGTVQIIEDADSGAPANGFFNTTDPSLGITEVTIAAALNASVYRGAAADTDATVNKKIIVGMFGGNNSSSNFMTVENVAGTLYIRPIAGNEDLDSNAAPISNNITVSNLNVDSDVSALELSDDDNFSVLANLNIFIPVGAGTATVADELKGKLAFNSWRQNGFTVTMSEQNDLYLGNFAGDSGHSATKTDVGSGMILFTGTNNLINGGSLQFGNQEAIIRSNSTTAIIRSAISGSSGLTKVGFGPLDFMGKNDYTGVTTVGESELVLHRDTALGLAGVGNGTVVTRSTLTLNDAINVGNESLLLNQGVTFRGGDRHNTWSGDVVLATLTEGGQNTNVTLAVQGNGVLTLNGAVSGGGPGIDPDFNAVGQRRQVVIQGDNTPNRGIINFNGALSDFNGVAAAASADRLELVVRGQNNLVTPNNDFNVFFADTTQLNGRMDVRSGFVHLETSYGGTSPVDPSGNATDGFLLRLTDNGASDNLGVIGGIFLKNAGSAYNVGSANIGESGNVQFSRHSYGMLGGFNDTGIVTFGENNVNGFGRGSLDLGGDTAISRFVPTTTVNATTGANMLTLSSVSELVIGLEVRGTNIPAGTTITGIAGNVVTLSNPISNNINSGAQITFPLYNVTATAVSGSNTLTLNRVLGLRVGMAVPEISNVLTGGTTITSISGNTITISTALIANLNAGSEVLLPVRSVVGDLPSDHLLESRFYAREGGITDIRMRIFEDANATADLSNEVGVITKLGRGTVQLSGSSAGASNIDGGIVVNGGKLVFDYSDDTLNNSRVNNSTGARVPLVLGGGELSLQVSNVFNAAVTENIRGELSIRPGASTVSGVVTSGLGLNIRLGPDIQGTAINPFHMPFRYAGGTVDFVHDGQTSIFYGNKPAVSVPVSSIISYATYNRLDGFGDSFKDFAALDFVAASTGAPVEIKSAQDIGGLYANEGFGYTADVTTWGTPANLVSGNYSEDFDALSGGGFTGTMTASHVGIRNIRFLQPEVSTINQGSFALVLGQDTSGNPVQDGGAILISDRVANNNKTITGGDLTSKLRSTYFNATSSVNGDINGASGVGGLATTVILPGSSANATSTDLIIHNYGEGLFTIASNLVNSSLGLPLNFVHSGTGTTLLTGTNTFSGSTYVGGGTLWIDSIGKLGAAPVAVNSDSIYLNGGVLEFAGATPALRNTQALTITVDANRGITLGGNGSTIRTTAAGTVVSYAGIVRSEDSSIPYYTGINAGDNSRLTNLGVGDFIKEGAGRLILSNGTAITAGFAKTGGWNAYYGLTEVNEGVLELQIGATANSGILGSNFGLIDGTIVGDGASLLFSMSSATASSAEWITLTQGATLGTTVAHTNGILEGVIEVTGDASINLAAGILNLNENTGHVMGSGDLEKNGVGTLVLSENNSSYTGDWVINNGTVRGRSQGQALGSGATIALGDDLLTVSDNGSTAALQLQSRGAAGGFTNEYVLGHQITVRAEGSAFTQTKEIGVQNLTGFGINNDRYVFNGNVTLNDDVRFAYRDESANAQLLLPGSNAQGSQQAGQFRFVAFNGVISGTGNIETVVNLTAGGANLVRATFELNNDNSAWAGDLTAGNATNIAAQHHTVRLGNANALQSDNDVNLQFNNTIQVGGGNVTIGNLNVLPVGIAVGTGANTGGIIVENAANAASVLTATQTVDENWDVLFRNGTTPDVYSNSTAAIHSNTLSIVKAGSAKAVLTQNNEHTGTTTVATGILQVGSGGSNLFRALGDTGGNLAGQGATTVNSGAFLGGTGTIQGVANTTNHVLNGTLQPGDYTGIVSQVGKLDVVGNLNASSGTMEFQLAGNSMPDPTLATLMAGTVAYDNRVSTQLATYEGSVTRTSGGANHDFLDIAGQFTLASGTSQVSVTSSTYAPVAGDVFDLIDWTSIISGGFNLGTTTAAGGALLRDGGSQGDLDLPVLTSGLSYDVSKFLSNGIIIVALNAVPEPSRVLLVSAGLMALLMRRRRRMI